MGITRETVTKARSWTAEEFNSILNNEFLFSAKSALARGLVDSTGRKEAIIEVIKEISGEKSSGTFALYGDPDTSLTGSKYLYGPDTASILSRPPIIAIIYANGVTDMERGMAAQTLARIIREESEKKRVKAIVIRINSPGGSAEAADYIADAVKIAKERIPVVVSMGAVAASGGYWASMTASHITASPVTLTGSIGVIGTWLYDNGLNDKLGFTIDAMQRGDHADLLNGIILPRRDLNQAEEARYREYILDLYSGFTAKVAASRNMDIARVESLAQGRVFSGIAAFNSGLIDSIGGLDDAINIARNLAKIPDDKKVTYKEFPKQKFMDKLIDRFLAIGSFFGRIKAGNNAATTASSAATATLFVADLFLPAPLLEDIRYRIAHNGKVMPILPLGW
jgi:protease-4